MLRPRITPTLLVHDGGLVKTVQFGDPKYVGDPINAVRIFNDKEVDELVVVDIDATVRGREPDYALIRRLAAECRMPLCYGGGVSTVDQIASIIALGVEKVALSAAAIADPDLIARASRVVGAQSIVVVLDVRRTGRTYEVFTHNGRRGTGRSPVELARQAEDLGAGEIVVNAIDRDGVMKGYDLDLVREVREAVTLPMTALGGAGSLADLETLLRTFGIIGAGAGSLFVFKGVFRAVLINYPARPQKERLFAAALAGRDGGSR